MKILKVVGMNGEAKLSTEYPLFGQYLGVYSIFIKYDNLVHISQNGILSIRNKEYLIKKGYYNINNLSPISELKISLTEDRKIQVVSSLYFHFNRSLCRDLGLEYKSADYSLVGEKRPVLDVCYFINIEQECAFNFGSKSYVEHHIVPKGIYRLNELAVKFTPNARYEANLQMGEDFSLIFSSKMGYKFDTYLCKVLGFDPKKLEHIPFTEGPYLKSVKSDFAPILMTKPCFRNLSGKIIVPSEQTYNFSHNDVTLDYLKTLQTSKSFPNSVKFDFPNDIVSISYDKYFELDADLPNRFKITIPSEFSVTGIQVLPVVDITNKLFEVHCNVVEKSVTSNNLSHIEEEILFTFSASENNYVIPNEVLFIPILQKRIQHMLISINSIQDELLFIPEFTIYILLK